MTIEIFTNRDSQQSSGFTHGQFRKLDAVYLRGAGHKVLYNRAVDCDLDEGVARFTYYRTQHGGASFQFVIHRVGPRTNMYELYIEGKGRVMKSGMFERVYQRLCDEVEALIETD